MVRDQVSEQDLFSLYFEYVKDTEPPLIYHRWSLIASVGAFLGRRFYLPFGVGKILPNQYVMLIGNPGTRKSSAIKTAKRVLSGAGYNTFSAEKTTKEKFLLDLEGLTSEDDYLGKGKPAASRDPGIRDILSSLSLTADGETHDGIPREVFITADEFNEFAGTGNLDFLSTLGALWDWDDEDKAYSQRFKNSKSINIYQPTISIIGGNTHSSFQLAFPSAALGQGFLSRLILVHSEPSGRKITFPKKPDDAVAIQLFEAFNRIRTTVKGPAVLDPAAERTLDSIYRTWPELEDYRFKAYSTRRFTHLLKLVLVCTALRCSTTVTQADVILANTILTYTEQSMSKALSEYGNSRHAAAAHALMTALYESRKLLKFEDLWKIVQRDLEKREMLTDLIRNLSEAGKIKYDTATQGFLAAMPKLSNQHRYIDLKLLKEASA